MYRGPATVDQELRLDGSPMSDETRAAVEQVRNENRNLAPGEQAGTLPSDQPVIILPDDQLPEDNEGGDASESTESTPE